MKFFTTLSLLFAVGSATPVGKPDIDLMPLEKRDTEVIYLSNCVDAVACCRPTLLYSRILYYPTSAASQNGQVPANENACRVGADKWTVWESGSPSCTFTSGVTFTAHLDADAASRPLYSWAGWGSNGFKNWNCYKDNDRVLFDPYYVERLDMCRSTYYCIPQ